MRLEEITKRMHVGKECVKGLKCGDTQMFTGCGEEEESAKDTKKEQKVKLREIERALCSRSSMKETVLKVISWVISLRILGQKYIRDNIT